MSHFDSKLPDFPGSLAPDVKRQPPPAAADAAQLLGEIARLQVELHEQTRRSVLALEAERESIARELHDNFGQFLTVMEMELDGIIGHAPVSADLRARMMKLKSLTVGARRDIGRVAAQIRPVSLNGVGLQDACIQLVTEWKNRSSLEFDVHVSIDGKVLSPLIETVLFRVLQEAITNIVRHAGATRAGIVLQSLTHNVQLVVEDDGLGFIPGESRLDLHPSHFGLLGMRERLALVGGSLEIESAPGKGTALLVNVPL